MVYEAKSHNGDGRLVLKTCPLLPTAVARIQREIGILKDIDSKYFPKSYFNFFVTRELLDYFVDNLPKEQKGLIEKLRASPPGPFLVTVEEFIEHIQWADAATTLKKEGPLLDFLIHLFSALQLLWDRHIVHRDLKPENILIRSNFEPVIIDLGIAKNMKDGATNITHPALASPCTPSFAAPEQLTNNKTEVTYKTDQFAVGVIVFLLLANRFPFGDAGQLGIEGVVNNFFNRGAEDIRQYDTATSDELVVFLKRLLMVHPFQRFRTAEEILETLRGIRQKRVT